MNIAGDYLSPFVPAPAFAGVNSSGDPDSEDWIPAISAFTRVHSPSKTGVNALEDALCAGMNGRQTRSRCAPSPHRGEGWGEGGRDLSRDFNPSPHPSPSRSRIYPTSAASNAELG